MSWATPSGRRPRAPLSRVRERAAPTLRTSCRSSPIRRRQIESRRRCWMLESSDRPQRRAHRPRLVGTDEIRGAGSGGGTGGGKGRGDGTGYGDRSGPSSSTACSGCGRGRPNSVRVRPFRQHELGVHAHANGDKSVSVTPLERGQDRADEKSERPGPRGGVSGRVL